MSLTEDAKERRKQKRKRKLLKKRLTKINTREHERLGGSNVPRTKHFRSPQTFGPASPVRVLYSKASEQKQKKD